MTPTLSLVIDGPISAPSEGSRGKAAKRMLHRSQLMDVVSRCWEHTLLQSYFPNQDISIASIYQHGELFPIDGDYVLRCDPIQLIADRDALFASSADINLSHEECSQIGEMLNRHFASDDLQFICHHPRRWYVLSKHKPEFSSPHLADILNQHLPIQSLFAGVAAQRWRSILNEIQMLLYAAPVNQQREAQGRALCSSVWFWGGGKSCPSFKVNLLGQHPFVQGLAQILGQLSREIETGQQLAECLCEGENLWVVAGQGTDNINELFDCSATLLHNGSIQELRILMGHGGIQITRQQYQQWWKKNKKMEKIIWQELLNVAS